jgi:hypothetical protein
VIHALRRRHRFAAAGLALALPPAFALALASRAPEARNPESLPAALGERVERLVERETSPARLTGPIAVAFGVDTGGARAVELDTRGAPVVPDALVYWSAGAGAPAALPAAAVFLGALPADAVRVFRLPADAAGAVVVFSLAWQTVVAAVPVAAESQP